MKYNFDEIVARRGTNCVKWDEADRDDIIVLGQLPLFNSDGTVKE